MKWVLEQLEHVAQFGKEQSGVTRLAFTPAEQDARNYIITLMQNIGLTIHIDAVGNIIGRYQPSGTDSENPAVATGSHLDTVPCGGKYDGILGVICGLAAINHLKEQPLRTPLEIIVFAAEEASRFNMPTIGSKAMAGLLTNTALTNIKDENGISLSSELHKLRLPVNDISAFSHRPSSIKAFVELHIEQGLVLEQGRINIGIVDKVLAPTRLKIVVVGSAGHSGVVPIEERQDALVTAAAIVLAIRNIAAEYEYQGAAATVTNLKTCPGTVNVIPAQVEMWVDIRGTEHESIIEILQEIKDAVSSITEDYDTPATIEVLSSERPVILDSTINQVIENVCCKLSLASIRLDSRVGHDAMNIAHIAPAALLYVPCQDGISHNPYEQVDNGDIENGLKVLMETLYQLAK
ncbi:MAG: putative hydrolase [Firmicutes bacterium]|nr:putative hydrolase [Bacillota bacterium]